MYIIDLLKEIEYENYTGNNEIDITGISCDSKKVKQGDIFVAIKGFTANGHKYISDAIKNGASAVICEYIPDNLKDISNFLLVKSSRASMASVANVIYGYPSKKINIIGITGTNGKTSTTYLLKGIYDYLKEKSGIIGTMGTLIDGEKIKTDNTTPESTDNQNYLSKMVEKSITHCFMEVSSHALELNRVDEISIDVGIFTNLTRDHLDFHKTMENYYNAKKKLFYKTKTNNIINIDDPYGERLYKELIDDGIKAMSYGIDNEADIKASNLITTMKGTSFDCNIKGIIKKIHVKTPGKFSVLNSLGALGAAYSLGVDLNDIVNSLSEFKGVTGRFQILETALDCTVILDFAHTPDGLQKVMDTINEFAEARKIVMFGAGGERDLSRRAPMGEISGKYCDLSILTSDNPRFENPYDICMEIAQGVEKSGGKYKIIIERDEAIYYAIDNYQSKDVILLAGKSTEPYQDMGVEKIPYDETTIAKRAIKEIEQKHGLRKN
ncbi:UDP-N-acetylmuramoyl-L-alanyl-D-glutamate--2,6-diaminopimelate ligase [Sedimentibacter acidaminivorans]|uniref:UDP-N-acetylmuramoyl-L-alanyl-D-glutamate--2,6-diaminopimelate ligase n=1 Tax=Sedimentibacter acidaminivorans TaxID=913099 RepID=A0ABS4G922_9FIRM|nr:UDP-N-acetylmuramoyl-L-alanyl-D-glutamate--2,6-diaminopimelate ligase [Sedimentibacter acidaminivorans]MBP1924182.1 UDP-N-acetylmuramoyl-L-alanyl-D-glutamate--2,6-diaminopimelate ligase [Sedimentibacter acidaminivorans]